MNEITEISTGEFLVNGIKINPGTNVIDNHNPKVGIYNKNTKRYDADLLIFSDWLDSNGDPYTSYALLLSDLQSKFFSASAGGSIDVTPLLTKNEEIRVELEELNTEKTNQTQAFPAGTNTNIPAGLLSVTILRLSGAVTVDTGNGTFLLNNSQRGLALSTTEDKQSKGILPAISISGGTWQWIGTEELT